jgi:hypothetical protein
VGGTSLDDDTAMVSSIESVFNKDGYEDIWYFHSKTNAETYPTLRFATEVVEDNTTTYTITYNCGKMDKGTFAVNEKNEWSEVTDSVAVGSAATVTLPAVPTQTSGTWVYDFQGWSVNDGEPTKAETVDISDNATITAVWKLHSLNGDGKWNIDDVLTLMSCASKPGVYQLTDEQRDCISLGNADPTMTDVRTLMQKISTGVLT